MVVEHITTLSELTATSAPIMSFTSDGSLFKFFSSKLSALRLGVAGSYKYLGKKYDNVLGFRIPDLLLNLLYCRGFLKKN